MMEDIITWANNNPVIVLILLIANLGMSVEWLLLKVIPWSTKINNTIHAEVERTIHRWPTAIQKLVAFLPLILGAPLVMLYFFTDSLSEYGVFSHIAMVEGVIVALIYIRAIPDRSWRRFLLENQIFRKDSKEASAYLNQLREENRKRKSTNW